jgi:hypothetical protein
MIAGTVVYHSSNIQDSLTILDLIMRGHELRKLYINNFAFGQTLAKKLIIQLRWLAHDIYNHLVLLILFRKNKRLNFKCF